MATFEVNFPPRQIADFMSEVLVLGDKQDKVAAAFGKTLENDFMTLEGVVSRKKQVVPQITEELIIL